MWPYIYHLQFITQKTIKQTFLCEKSKVGRRWPSCLGCFHVEWAERSSCGRWWCHIWCETLYNTVIGKAADKFAPLRSRKVKSRAGKPWYTADIHSARVTRRKLEGKAMKSGLTIDRQIYREHCIKVVHLIDDSKHTYYRSNLFKLVVTLTSDRQKILPTCDSDTVLANKVSVSPSA